MLSFPMGTVSMDMPLSSPTISSPSVSPPLMTFDDIASLMRPSKHIRLAPITSGIPRLPSAPGLTATAINSISFSSNGATLVSSAGDDAINVLDAMNGRRRATVPCIKYGTDNAQFIPGKGSEVVHSSLKLNDHLRLMSLDNKTYIRYFVGHKTRVSCLAVAPNGNSLLSSSAIDKSVRLWDIRAENAVGIISVQSMAGVLQPSNTWMSDVMKTLHIPFPRPVLGFDPFDTIFAIGYRDPDWVKLFDMRNLKGSFKTINVPLTMAAVSLDVPVNDRTMNGEKNQHNSAMSADFAGLKFSPDGKKLMVYTNGPFLYLLDAFSGNLLHAIQREKVASKEDLVRSTTPIPEACFSPDSEYVMGGNGNRDNAVYMWSVKTGKLVEKLAPPERGPHIHPKDTDRAINYVAFSPQHYLMATAGESRLTLWCPSLVKE